MGILNFKILDNLRSGPKKYSNLTKRVVRKFAKLIVLGSGDEFINKKVKHEKINLICSWNVNESIT